MSTLPNTIETPDLPELTQSPDATEPLNTPRSRSVDQVPVKISAVLGKTRIDVAALRDLNDGAIIELDRKVGDPIDLYVNDRLIGRGELVMVDGVLGVTLTEIVKDDEI